MKLEGLTYRQLGKVSEIRSLGYELHHMIPRYRLKGYPNSFLNCPENIAILTAREHLLAHYHLCLFETGKYKHSARVAFLMLFNLKKLSFSEIEALTKEEIDVLLDNAVESRKTYFGSEQHKRGSSKAGKVAGEKRKEAFANDPEFRKYMLSKLKLSPEKRKQISDKRILENKDKPLWRINNASKQQGKYIQQAWEYFDSIYIGVVKYNYSYKLIAKILGLNYKRISNIVKTIKQGRHPLPIEFSEYIFAKDFYLDFNCTYTENVKEVYEYYQKETPWNKHFDNSCWLSLDKFKSLYPRGCRAYRLRKDHDVSFLQSNKISAVLKSLSDLELESWEYYETWCYFKSLNEKKYE